MSKRKKAPVSMDASLALEMEVGDDSAAYKMSKRELAEFLDDEECAICGHPLDAFGDCAECTEDMSFDY